MSMDHCYVPVAAIKSPGVGVTLNCELSNMGAGNQSWGPLEEQVLSPTEPYPPATRTQFKKLHGTQLDQTEVPGIRKVSSTSVSSSSSYGMLTSRSAALTSFFTFSGKGDKFTWVLFHTPCSPPRENNQCPPKMLVNHSITNGN